MTKLLNNPLIATMLLFAVIAACFLVLAISGQSTLDRVEWNEEMYIVGNGDSLWALSGRYCPDGVDRWEWIEEVQYQNGLDDSVIYPGQRLTILVPVEEG